MSFRAKMEVHFHDQDVASVVLDDTGGPDRDFGHLLLFTHFALRQMVNLGGDVLGRSLGEVLTHFPGNLPAAVQLEHPDAPRLVVYQGAAGRRRFVCGIHYDAGVCTFTLDPKGFGVFARGVGYYAPTSVMLVARYFAEKHADAPIFVAALERAAALAGDAFLQGGVGVSNQTRVALEVVSAVWPPGSSNTSAEVSDGAPPSDPCDAPGRLPPEIPPAVASLLAATGPRSCDDLRRAMELAGRSLSHRSVEPATRLVFEELVTVQVEIFDHNLPTGPRPDPRELRRHLGGCLMDGYALGRVVAGTSEEPVAFTSSDADARDAANQIRRISGQMPASLLEEGGPGLSEFARRFSAYLTTQVPYAGAQPAERAAMAAYMNLMNGFCLAMAEHIVAALWVAKGPAV